MKIIVALLTALLLSGCTNTLEYTDRSAWEIFWDGARNHRGDSGEHTYVFGNTVREEGGKRVYVEPCRNCPCQRCYKQD